jgi:hypothetical protein
MLKAIFARQASSMISWWRSLSPFQTSMLMMMLSQLDGWCQPGK